MEKELSEMTLEELWELFPIELKEHSTEYAKWYEDEKKSILKAFNGRFIERISHIGSTAVPGLLSKPTVDILLEIEAGLQVQKVVEILETLGWTLMTKQEKPNLKYSLNKGYTKYGFAKKVFHLHIKRFGDCDELYFRDYLLEHSAVCTEYAALKKMLQIKYRNDRDGYTDAKTDFVRIYTEKALERYNARYIF